MRHNDANRMTLTSAFKIFILRNLIVGWGRGLLKRGLVFCIKSIDLGEMLIVGREGFVKVRVATI